MGSMRLRSKMWCQGRAARGVPTLWRRLFRYLHISQRENDHENLAARRNSLFYDYDVEGTSKKYDTLGYEHAASEIPIF